MSIVIREHVKKVVFDFGDAKIPDIFQGDSCKVIINNYSFDEHDEKTTHYRFKKDGRLPMVRLRISFDKPLPAACTHLSLVGTDCYPELHEGLKYLELIDVHCSDNLFIPSSVETLVTIRSNFRCYSIRDTMKTLVTDLRSRSGLELGYITAFRMCPGGSEMAHTVYMYPNGVENITFFTDSIEHFELADGHHPDVVFANCYKEITPRELYKKFKGCTVSFDDSSDLQLECDYEDYVKHRAAKRAAKKRRLEE